MEPADTKGAVFGVWLTRLSTLVRRSGGERQEKNLTDPWPWPRRTIAKARLRLIIFSALLIFFGLYIGVRRVVVLEMNELDHFSNWHILSPTQNGDGTTMPLRELTRVRLARGESVTFEVCTADPMMDRQWEGAVDFTVWHLDSSDLVLRTPLSRQVLAQARRHRGAACLIIAEGGHLEVGGQYAVAAVWPGRDLPLNVQQVPVRARIQAQTPLVSGDLFPVALLAMGVFMLALCLTPARREAWLDKEWRVLTPAEPSTTIGAGHELLQVAVGLGGLVAAGVVVGLLPVEGASGVLFRGLSLAVVQLVVAATLVGVTTSPPGGKRAALGLVTTRRSGWILWFAPAAGLLLWLFGRFLIGLSPTVIHAPIMAATAWPSGRLAVALVGVLVPCIEEIFFRGFLFGALSRKWNGTVAFVATTILFAAAHLPQCWGAWGGLVAIFVLGAALTAMRWRTGSVVASSLAHIVYNSAITILSVGTALLSH